MIGEIFDYFEENIHKFLNLQTFDNGDTDLVLEYN
jgi:hypothetical protein